MLPMTTPSIHVACLCAAWCRLCDEYAPVLRQVVAELAAAGVPLRAHWIDIEDQADLLGELDIETFPTLVVFDDQALRFAGPLTPQADTLRRVLRATLQQAEPTAQAAAAGAAFEAFVQRLRQQPDIAAGP
jgi:thioredoxin-like negative regulator of GroEL